MSPQTVDEIDLESLIARFRTGDSVALSILMERLTPRLLAFIANQFSGLDAEDVVQEAWLRAWNSRAQFVDQGMAAFRSWLFRIASNNAISQLRKKRAIQLPENVDLAARELDREDPLLDELRDCLEQFQRVNDAFVSAIAAQLQGASTVEMARAFEIAEGTVFSRLSRGRQLLKECVESKRPEK